MIVKCVATTGTSLPKDSLLPSLGYDENTDFNLEVGRAYVVYALTLFNKYVWYCVLEKTTTCPYFKPAPLFTVMDGRLSRYWVYSYKGLSEGYKGLAEGGGMIFDIAYPEWADDQGYYARLVDGQKREVLIFETYKRLMDVEFPNNTIKVQAKQLGDSWIMCNNCGESWQGNILDGMVSCPRCGTVEHNPLYQPQQIPR